MFTLPKLSKPKIISGALACATLAAGVFTYATLSSGTPIDRNPDRIAWVLAVDIVVLLALTATIVRQVVSVYLDQRRGAGASHLHMRMVAMFAILATLPSILMIVFTAFYFQLGVQSWFSDQIKGAVNNAQTVAEAYLDEHRQVIRADIIAAATDIERQADLIYADPGDLKRFLDTQSFLRNFNESVLFDVSGRVIARGGVGLTFDPSDLPPGIVSNATGNDPVVFTARSNDEKIRAIVQLPGFGNGYLYVNRSVDARVLSYVSETRDAASAYGTLEKRRSDVQFTFFAVYVAVSLLMLLSAVWAGLYYAGKMVAPIDRLMGAADSVRSGNLQTRLNPDQGLTEFDNLAVTFNRMTEELDRQRRELQAAERKAAWSDVARRVAHEIKNPLTPIQLSAERLRRRFLKNIPEADQAVYTQCIDTIVRHVGDMGRMVSEFAGFARMPEPVAVRADLGDLIRDVVALHQSSRGHTLRMDLSGVIGDAGVQMPAMIDPGQLRQAMTNLVLNACESVIARVAQTPEPPGRVRVEGMVADGRYVIAVLDNGLGFPGHIALDRLGDPYVTSKEKGTGLGLAIVKKIIQDHHGSVKLGAMDDVRIRNNWGTGGAIVVITLPIPLDQNENLKNNISHAA